MPYALSSVSLEPAYQWKIWGYEYLRAKKECENLGGNEGCKNLDENKGYEILLVLIRGTKERLRGAKISMENLSSYKKGCPDFLAGYPTLFFCL